MGRFLARALGVLAIVAGALAVTRLTDAVGKRQLLRVAHELSSEVAGLRRAHDRLLVQADRMELDRQLLEHRLAVISKREHYLVVLRAAGKLRLGLEDKVLLEVPVRVRGPVEAVDAFLDMPRTTYEVLEKKVGTSWYRPDWLYRLEGVAPPSDSASRVVQNALGPVALFLGGGLAIHGPLPEDVPSEAIDYVFLQVDTLQLKSVCSSLRPGAMVFIQ